MTTFTGFLLRTIVVVSLVIAVNRTSCGRGILVEAAAEEQQQRDDKFFTDFGDCLLLSTHLMANIGISRDKERFVEGFDDDSNFGSYTIAIQQGMYCQSLGC